MRRMKLPLAMATARPFPVAIDSSGLNLKSATVNATTVMSPWAATS